MVSVDVKQHSGHQPSSDGFCGRKATLWTPTLIGSPLGADVTCSRFSFHPAVTGRHRGRPCRHCDSDTPLLENGWRTARTRLSRKPEVGHDRAWSPRGRVVTAWTGGRDVLGFAPAPRFAPGVCADFIKRPSDGAVNRSPPSMYL